MISNDFLSIDISILDEETVFEKVISSPKSILLESNLVGSAVKKSKSSTPVLKPTEYLAASENDSKPDAVDDNSTVIVQADIITAELEEKHAQKQVSVTAVPFYSCAVESVFRSFPFAQQDLNVNEQINNTR